MKQKLPYVVLAASLALVTIGLSFGEFGTTLSNAVMVCLRCIGIG